MSLIYTIFEGKESKIIDEATATEFLATGCSVQVTGPLETIYAELKKAFPYPEYRSGVARKVGDRVILFISKCSLKNDIINYPPKEETENLMGR